MGNTVLKAMRVFEVERKEAISRDNISAAQDKLLTIVEEVRSSAKDIKSPSSSQGPSPRRSRFDKYVDPKGSGGSRSSQGGGGVGSNGGGPPAAQQAAP
eukprot:3780886-Karenia_brevis.AAC.1